LLYKTKNIKNKKQEERRTGGNLIKGAKKTSFTFKGLNISNSWSKYTYYCRVRAYKEKNKIKAYSDWSNEKEITIKK